MQTQNSQSLKVVIRVRPLQPKQQDSIQQYEGYTFGKKRNQKGKLSQAALNFYAKYHHIRPKDAIKINQNVLSVCDQEYKNTDRKMRDFHFQQVFTPEYSNQHIFSQTIKDELGGVLEGVNYTLLAYGITGSGKTFSVFGHPKLERGISYLAFDHLFALKAQQEKKGVKVNFKFTFIEIYNENVRDLLSEDGKRQVTIGQQKGVVTLSDALEVPIHSVEEIATLISYGIVKRTSATTDSNLLSSRSHAILKLSVDCIHNGHSTHSKLFIIDLAGSEKLSIQSNQRKNQGSNINRSLLTLGNCINALVENSKKANSAHVPYRDSKLTRLLKDSLGGNARTVMISCISSNPFTLDETITTLNYAERAQGIKKDIMKNIRLTQSECPRCKQMNNSTSPRATPKREDPFENINLWQSPKNYQDSQMSSIFLDICQKLYQDIVENARQCQQIQRLRVDIQDPCEQFQLILKDNEQQRVHLKQILFNLLGQKSKIVVKESEPRVTSARKKIKLNCSLQKGKAKSQLEVDEEEKENHQPMIDSSKRHRYKDGQEKVLQQLQPILPFVPQPKQVTSVKKEEVLKDVNAESRASCKKRRSKFEVVPRPSSLKKRTQQDGLRERETSLQERNDS